jgi:hypothetical protein
VAETGTPATPAGAGPSFEVSGSVETEAGGLEVHVELANRGERAGAPVTVEGELLGARREARVESEIPPGESRRVMLPFSVQPPRPGVYALALLIESPGPGGLTNSQRAYLLLALGANAEPAVRIDVPKLSLDTRGPLAVQIESRDGAAHRVRVRALTPRDLRAEDPAEDVQVPARGEVSVPVTLLRAGAPRGTRRGILVVAATTDGTVERTTVATGVVDIASDPAWMPRPRVRPSLLVLAALLLAGAAFEEVRRGRAGRGKEPS